jgi:hypothetical protein
MLEKIKWVYAVLKTSNVRVDQMELHTRLAACTEKLEEIIKELSENEADNEQE